MIIKEAQENGVADAFSETPQNGMRRSKRNRLAPTAYWKSAHPNYKRAPGAVLEVDMANPIVQENPTPVAKQRRKSRRKVSKKARRVARPTNTKGFVSSDDGAEQAFPGDDSETEFDGTGMTIDPETKKERPEGTVAAFSSFFVLTL